MKKDRNAKSIEQRLHQLMDEMVLEPEQKKLAARAMRSLLHANKVSDIKSLTKAIDQFLGVVLRGGDRSNNNDD